MTAAPVYRNLFDPDAFIFGIACRQVAAKGVDLLLRAIPRVSALAPTTRFLIAGDGPRLNEYAELARSLEVDDKVVFLGRCNSMPEFYASLNTFVLPSRDEGLPIALLEAMASGRMVIATDVGSVGSVVHDQETGLLIAPDNLEALILCYAFGCVQSGLPCPVWMCRPKPGDFKLFIWPHGAPVRGTLPGIAAGMNATQSSTTMRPGSQPPQGSESQLDVWMYDPWCERPGTRRPSRVR